MQKTAMITSEKARLAIKRFVTFCMLLDVATTKMTLKVKNGKRIFISHKNSF